MDNPTVNTIDQYTIPTEKARKLSKRYKCPCFGASSLDCLFCYSLAVAFSDASFKIFQSTEGPTKLPFVPCRVQHCSTAASPFSHGCGLPMSGCSGQSLGMVLIQRSRCVSTHTPACPLLNDDASTLTEPSNAACPADTRRSAIGFAVTTALLLPWVFIYYVGARRWLPLPLTFFAPPATNAAPRAGQSQVALSDMEGLVAVTSSADNLHVSVCF